MNASARAAAAAIKADGKIAGSAGDDSLVVELQAGRFDEGRAPLVRHVVDDEDSAAVRHLAVVAVVGLREGAVCAC
jgi:hypothetical protein